MRKQTIALLLLAVFLSLGIPVQAAQLPDLSQKGSLTIVMEFDCEHFSGGSLTSCRVGRVRVLDTDADFVLLEELGGGELPGKLDNPDLAKELALRSAYHSLPLLHSEIQEGAAVFTGLEPGLYVVTQTEPSDGFFPIQTFLLSLPRWTEDGYVYDLTAAPKVPLEPEPTEPSEPTAPTVPPKPGTTLPQTGQLNWPVPVLAILGLTLFGTGWFLCFCYRREPDEA